MSGKVRDEAPQEYACLVPIDHTADGRIYPVGSVIRLAHLTAAQVHVLVTAGYVRPVVREQQEA